MGGLVIDTVRPGVQFTPDAAAAFRRAEAQVQREFDRNIDVNSTYRSWATQLKMYNAWNRYVASGYKPSLYPGHSKAIHPRDSFHVQGTALDSDDWTNARIRAILEQNGFIRNRLHVPNERHHFEYIRARDKNHGKPAGGGAVTPAEPVPVPEEENQSEEDTMKIFGYKNPNDRNRTYYVEMDSGSGFWHEWVSDDEAYISSYAAKWTPEGIPLFSLGHRNGLKAECDRISGRSTEGAKS